ncbi:MULTISPECIES: class Ib ribonucleoside-diphosphate reductase assembly flavoprotein NrdI [unclassified Vibrio]|uniref:Protein NrdI n=1 Tax=Vibrio sp. HB236076 TaxID=3232307 RepID=A0AB39H7N9_9VIBR|nr:class Ib ribonucleoside-diphosphate reductase assembly flavoprotein NrdI [Vibrio sp. HB161653]MDP5253432.1 class Ib ribonucleoside-diphosphate reductase assembly flavoprotein NrdI [Vibrio sp. HB161653]
MADLVYFSSQSGNTQRFVERLNLDAMRLPIEAHAQTPLMAKPFVLVCPSYADGQGRGAVPKSVIHFLNQPQNRQWLRGVIGSGNRNFGVWFARAGDIIAEKCQVPVLYRFELAGTDNDVTRVKQGLTRFWEHNNE